MDIGKENHIVTVGDREYIFVSKKEFFVLVEDDAHIIIRRKTCPQPTSLPPKP